MTMRPIKQSLAALLAIILGLAWSTIGLAQDAPKDDALDGLLKKLEESKRDGEGKKALDAKADPAGRAPGEVAPKDKALDSLLEKLGQTTEKPAPDERRKAQGQGEADKPPVPP